MEDQPVATSFKTVWAVLDLAKHKSQRVRDNIQYLVDGSMSKEAEEDEKKEREDPIPSINTLQSWADNIDATLARSEELLKQLRGNN